MILGDAHIVEGDLKRQGKASWEIANKLGRQKRELHEGSRGFVALLLVDPEDDETALRIRNLMTKDDRTASSETEPYKGLNQLLSDIVYTVIGKWNALFNEAELH